MTTICRTFPPTPPPAWLVPGIRVRDAASRGLGVVLLLQDARREVSTRWISRPVRALLRADCWGGPLWWAPAAGLSPADECVRCLGHCPLPALA
ncbi:hypothetical protein [Streptomyces marincola]|uniref:Uncharacterized protein n=1 Tax=Streptomyces marincola TaxID=2878388 RepID=A0A1W7CYD5_9ACTN|nr:hypothetical protein [Streptomyces marincola]ARQ69861.1 hypothetical protein CAG99_14185 [Streptomyces marincola]UCM88991.1 hypothetical protein LC193_14110 [Streptomyces marincola]